MSIKYKNSDILSVSNVAGMFLLKVNDNQLVQTQGYTTDGVGANLYRYDAGSSATVDYGNVLDGIGGNGSGTGTGRFITVHKTFNASHFGCVDTPGVDNSTNLQRCIDAAEAQVVAGGGSWGGHVLIDLKYMRLNTGILIEQTSIKVKGLGTYSTSIDYAGSTGTVFHFTKGASGITQVGISDLSIYCMSTSNTKQAIKFTAAQESYIRNILIQSCIGGDSVGIQISGHQMIEVSASHIIATVPIRVSTSPIAGVDFDHCHFFDLYLLRSGAAPSTLEDALFLIDSDVYVSNLTVDGSIVFVGGKEGFYFHIAGSPKSISHGISINNVRQEQNTASGGFAVNVAGDSSHYILDVMCENIRAANGCVYGRYWYVATLKQLTSVASGALDVDIIANLSLDGYYLSHATGMSMGSMKMLAGTGISSGLGNYQNLARSIWTYQNGFTAKGFYSVLEDGIYSAADTTPSVKYCNLLVCTNGSATSITNFDDAVENQSLIVKCSTNTTIVHNASLIQLAGGANFVGPGTVTLYSVGGVWYESARSSY